jgi:tetratricopeptide (TPR) repeat protein
VNEGFKENTSMKAKQIKNILPFLFYFLVCMLSSQNDYKSIEAKINESIAKYSSSDENYTVFSTIHEQFKKAKRADKTMLSKDGVGIVAIIHQEKKNIELFPAKFSHSKGLINISALSKAENDPATADMQDYIEKYLYRIEYVGNTETFKTLIGIKPEQYYPYSSNNQERVIQQNEKMMSVFVRGNTDWIFAVSYSKTDIRFYAFMKNFFGEAIFGDGNTPEAIEKRRLAKIQKEKTEKEKFPLFHDVRTDHIRASLREIINITPFSADTHLYSLVDKLRTPITRYNLAEHVDAFNYFYQLPISSEFLKKHFEPSDDAYVIKHLCLHALADYHFSKGNFELAIAYYQKAVFESPYEVSSGTDIIKDIERIIFDLAKACYKAGRKDEAYGYLIGLMIDSQNKYNIAAKEIKLYMTESNEDANQFKKDIDKALNTIKTGQDTYSRTFTFRNKSVFFYPMLAESNMAYQTEFKASDFYKSLE